MTRRIVPALVTAGLAAAGLTFLAGCGKQGELARPAPLWGAEAKARYEAEQKAAAEAEKAPPNRAREDTSTNPAPSRQLPIEGQPPNPSGTAPQGVLPDPYARP